MYMFSTNKLYDAKTIRGKCCGESGYSLFEQKEEGKRGRERERANVEAE